MDTGINASIPEKKNAPSRHKSICNEAHLVRDRCINFNQRCRGQLESLCEDKVSKYKLERMHNSEISSSKSTFIMTFSPDGRKVASTHGDHCIYICDLNTGKRLCTLVGHPKTPWCLAWHPTNKDILASGCLAGEVRVWDLSSKSPMAAELWTSENNSIISSLDFHPKERILVIATANDILFWDWSQPRPFAKTTTTHDKEKVKFVEFDSSGTRLITGILNLPRFSGYGNDSLQNRIIDSYLTPGNIEPIQTENMTQNSETNTPSSNHNNNETSGSGRHAEVLPSYSNNRPSMPISSNNTNINEQQQQENLNHRSTQTLSRIACLYRQLEALEDSMRHTTFAPYPNARPSFGSNNTQTSNREAQQMDGSNFSQSSTDNEDSSSGQTGSSTNVAPSQSGELSSQSPLENSGMQQQQSIRSSNSFEPFVVSFDESLENLQLSPLVIDGQTINLATILEQYPIEFPHQVHFIMHYESINQVNQNFIRISKLMSSIRLFRQVVHQITSSNSGTGHFQPNQILTAQSTSLRSPRSPSGVPIIFRNLPMGSSQPDASNSFRTRPSDPVMAIQFRSSARNVPLVTICKIDLLSARSVCIMRSQQLIEQAIIDLRSSIRTYQISLAEMMGGARANVAHESGENEAHDRGSSLSFYQLLSQLHQSLTAINHAPLTTSNVHTHISSLRTLVSKLLNTLTSLLPNRDEGQRLIGLVHDIAHSLTGRSWTIPLGATLDDIRLDVIHTMCIVDLTLHLARQIQLLQMHRLSAMARIEEYRANASTNSSQETPPLVDTTPGLAPSVASSSQVQNPAENLLIPSTSRESSAIDQQVKRKKSDQHDQSIEVAKRRRVDGGGNSANDDTEMIDAGRSSTTSESNPADQRDSNQVPNPLQHTLSSTQSALQGPVMDNMPVERFIVWNSANNQADDQSLQRLFVATAAGLTNHILVRIYHTRSGANSSNMLDGSGERNVAPIESRRRALSQDNSSGPPAQESIGAPAVDGGRARYVQQNQPPSIGSQSNAGQETWNRAPHFHVIHARAPGQHLWFNQWTISMPLNPNYRLQCWNFRLDALPNIKDSQSNMVTQKCRIMNDSSIDLSSDGSLLACLVPRDDASCMPGLDLKIFSLKSWDFGTCYHQIAHGSNAISVSLSPTANYAVVGLASQKYISNDPSGDDLTIAKVFNLSGRGQAGYVRDIKIKRDDSSLILNAIRWMSRGIVYNVGPQQHQRYQAARMRNRFV